MTRREAVLAAAKHLHKYPTRFDYCVPEIPEQESDSACAICWIAYFKGTNGKLLDDKAKKAIGISYWKTFEARMAKMLGRELSAPQNTGRVIARGLRKYAKTYLSA